MNCSPRLWSGVEGELVRHHPELHVVHRRLDADTVLGCVEMLLSSLPPRFSLTGLSLGANVAIALVEHAPERVSRLCLMSANPYAPTPAQVAAWASLRRDLVAGRTARDVQRELLPVLLHPDRRWSHLAEDVLAMADETGEEMLGRQLLAQASRVDQRPALRRVAVPTLVVAAGEDALCPVWKHEEMRRLVPASELVVLDGVGHLSTLEAPDRVTTAMAEWLSRRPAASGRPSSSPA